MKDQNMTIGTAIRTGAILTLILMLSGAARAQADIVIAQTPGTDLIRFSTSKGGAHKLEIDDSDGFLTPVATKVFSGTKTEMHANEAGLIDGVAYRIRLDGGRTHQDLRLLPSEGLDSRVDCATLRHTWETTGRLVAGRGSSGMDWVGDHWEIIPHAYLVGDHLYAMAIVMNAAVVGARSCGDIKTLDEMAQYYNIMLRQTETVGDLLKRPAVHADSRNRLSHTDSSARTFVSSFGAETGEGELSNSQWLHPAGLLLRVVTLLPEASRTPAMKAFAGSYAQFLVKDQLLRLFFHQHMPSLGGIEINGRVASWKAIMKGLKGRYGWETAMSDIDLWLLASAAEVLGAHANDPRLVPIDDSSRAQLREAMVTGIALFQSKRTNYTETRNFQGRVVGSASYFNGDYATHPDLAFSAVGGAQFPTAAQRRANPTASWDIGHTYRLPIFLRALYENRKAIGSEFPTYKDLQLVVNQYLYRVFTGDYSKPKFRNYFDGSDTWMIADYNGSNFGYPPSDFCDMHNPMRPCFIPGAIIGWPELAFVNSDLARLERCLVDLAFANDSASVAFRDRRFFWGNPYRVSNSAGVNVFDGALYLVVAENADMIAAPKAEPH